MRKPTPNREGSSRRGKPKRMTSLIAGTASQIWHMFSVILFCLVIIIGFLWSDSGDREYFTHTPVETAENRPEVTAQRISEFDTKCGNYAYFVFQEKLLPVQVNWELPWILPNIQTGNCDEETMVNQGLVGIYSWLDLFIADTYGVGFVVLVILLILTSWSGAAAKFLYGVAIACDGFKEYLLLVVLLVGAIFVRSHWAPEVLQAQWMQNLIPLILLVGALGIMSYLAQRSYNNPDPQQGGHALNPDANWFVQMIWPGALFWAIRMFAFCFVVWFFMFTATKTGYYLFTPERCGELVYRFIQTGWQDLPFNLASESKLGVGPILLTACEADSVPPLPWHRALLLLVLQLMFVVLMSILVMGVIPFDRQVNRFLNSMADGLNKSISWPVYLHVTPLFVMVIILTIIFLLGLTGLAGKWLVFGLTYVGLLVAIVSGVLELISGGGRRRQRRDLRRDHRRSDFQRPIRRGSDDGIGGMDAQFGELINRLPQSVKPLAMRFMHDHIALNDFVREAMQNDADREVVIAIAQLKNNLQSASSGPRVVQGQGVQGMIRPDDKRGRGDTRRERDPRRERGEPNPQRGRDPRHGRGVQIVGVTQADEDQVDAYRLQLERVVRNYAEGKTTQEAVFNVLRSGLEMGYIQEEDAQNILARLSEEEETPRPQVRGNQRRKR
ncbi:MAG: hypothetical protein ACOCXQ_04590 [Patescibacteria group bacterium]